MAMVNGLVEGNIETGKPHPKKWENQWFLVDGFTPENS